jgi:hypothetical protein
VQDQAIEQPAQSHPDDGGDPSKKEEQGLFEQISKEAGRLTM